MRIECTTTFLDGRERYEQGDVRTVDDTKGAYFVQNKWAKELGAASPTLADIPSTDLAIDSSVIGLGDNHG